MAVPNSAWVSPADSRHSFNCRWTVLITAPASSSTSGPAPHSLTSAVLPPRPFRSNTGCLRPVTPYGPDGTGRHTDRHRPHGPPFFTGYVRTDTLSDVNQQTVRAPLHQFSVPLSATRRGARLARLLAAERLGA